MRRDDWDKKGLLGAERMIRSAMLWLYRITSNKLTGQAPFRLVYGREVGMPMEYIVQSLRVETLTEITCFDAVEEILLQLIHLEEERFIAGFHQNLEKKRNKAWHDRHIKNNQFTVGGLVLMYAIKVFKHPGKLKEHWLGPCVVKEITDGGAVKLENIYGTKVKGMINGSRLKPYFDS